jgi:hypothetical protein
VLAWDGRNRGVSTGRKVDVAHEEMNEMMSRVTKKSVKLLGVSVLRHDVGGKNTMRKRCK